MKSAKGRIKEIVELYSKLHKDEFAAFKHGMEAVRASLKDEQFGTAYGKDSSSGYRALYEMPETLQTMLVKGLSDEEMLWLKTGTDTNRNEGGRWFAKTFPVFRIPDKI